MKRYGIPRLCFINKLDRTGANPDAVITKIRTKLGLNAAAVQVLVSGCEERISEGIVDVVWRRAWRFEGTSGSNAVTFSVPPKVLSRVEEQRAKLVEAIAEVDDELMEAVVADNLNVPPKALEDAIKRATQARTFVPVFLGSAYKNVGVQLLLDGVRDYLPNPLQVNAEEPPAKADDSGACMTRSVIKPETREDAWPLALAFKLEEGPFGQLTFVRVYRGSVKTGEHLLNLRSGKRIRVPRLVRLHSDEMETVTELPSGSIGAIFGPSECASGDTLASENDTKAEPLFPMHVPDPVVSLAVAPKNLGGSSSSVVLEKFSRALGRFQREDPTLRVHQDPESNETIVSGMGELHLQIYLERIRREYGCECVAGKPRVAYREQPTRASPFDYLHKKQTGGAGQYARVIGVLEPIPASPEAGKSLMPLEIVNEVVAGTIPTEFIPACEKVPTHWHLHFGRDSERWRQRAHCWGTLSSIVECDYWRGLRTLSTRMSTHSRRPRTTECAKPWPKLTSSYWNRLCEPRLTFPRNSKYSLHSVTSPVLRERW